MTEMIFGNDLGKSASVFAQIEQIEQIETCSAFKVFKQFYQLCTLGLSLRVAEIQSRTSV
jgi:hypothetical protein